MAALQRERASVMQEASRLRSELADVRAAKAAEEGRLQAKLTHTEGAMESLRQHDAQRSEVAQQLLQLLRTHYDAATRLAGRLASPRSDATLVLNVV